MALMATKELGYMSRPMGIQRSISSVQLIKTRSGKYLSSSLSRYVKAFKQRLGLSKLFSRRLGSIKAATKIYGRDKRGENNRGLQIYNQLQYELQNITYV